MNLTAVLRLLRYNLILWRLDAMYKQTMNAAKGIGLGLLAGTAVSVIGTKMMNGTKKNSMKKTAGKAMHSMSNLIADVEKMMK